MRSRAQRYEDRMIARTQAMGPVNWGRADADMGAAFRIWERQMRRSDISPGDVDDIVRMVRGGTILGRWCQWHFNEATAAESTGMSLERARELLRKATFAGFLHLYPDDLHGGSWIELDNGK